MTSERDEPQFISCPYCHGTGIEHAVIEGIRMERVCHHRRMPRAWTPSKDAEDD